MIAVLGMCGGVQEAFQVVLEITETFSWVFEYGYIEDNTDITAFLMPILHLACIMTRGGIVSGCTGEC